MLWFNKPYETLTFAEVWPKFDKFYSDFNSLSAGFPSLEETMSETIKENFSKTIFWLLYAKYGNNPIANSDVNQFKMKVFSIIHSYGYNWLKKEEIQRRLHTLAEADILVGAKQIYNHALNPNSEPSTSALEELEYINDQNTALHKKSVMEAYSILWSILHADHTKEFIDKFKKCFAVFVDKMPAPFYITDKDYLDEED